VIAHAERAATEAERLRGLESERAARHADDASLLLEVAERAGELSRLRTTAAVRLTGAVDATLQALGFRADAFEVAVGRRPAARDDPAIELGGDAVAFDATGADEVVFRFAPNAGEPSRPLARIASGGELSRVALAIKQVLAAADATPTLVFDEVDAGIGGRDADPIGRSLRTLGMSHQVLVVTHLPQIAAYADAHFRIAKREREGRTVTSVERLSDDARVGELAAMLGGTAGAGPGSAAEASARELLARVAGIPAPGPAGQP
jgi:DNA repair protein RecN (Recombination protein N)